MRSSVAYADKGWAFLGFAACCLKSLLLILLIIKKRQNGKQRT